MHGAGDRIGTPRTEVGSGGIAAAATGVGHAVLLHYRFLEYRMSGNGVQRDRHEERLSRVPDDACGILGRCELGPARTEPGMGSRLPVRHVHEFEADAP